MSKKHVSQFSCFYGNDLCSVICLQVPAAHIIGMTVLRESIGQPTGGRFAPHRRDEPTGDLLTAEDPYDYFDFAADAAAAEKPGEALTGRANGWFVEVSKTEVVAGRRGAGLTHKTDIHKFNAGWKVGFRWSPAAPPKSVVALAIKLSARLP